jgi:Na+-transporting methylmalonyl-CoA/oxaloacetate decarboxylase gamma subunit
VLEALTRFVHLLSHFVINTIIRPRRSSLQQEEAVKAFNNKQQQQEQLKQLAAAIAAAIPTESITGEKVTATLAKKNQC